MINSKRWEDMTPTERKRNGRIIAVVLALSIIISLAFLSFAFITKTNAERAAIDYEVKLHGLEAQLNSCVREAAAARDQAARAQAVADLARLEAVRQHELAERKK
jgi:hypothetical protein